MKHFLILCSLFLGLAANAQTTTISATVTDPDAINWANGTINFSLYNNQGGIAKINGVPLTPAQLTPSFNLDGTGSFSGAISSNTAISPTGTQWNVSVCPLASAPCQQLQRVTISGSTQSLTTTINSQLQALRFPASYQARAYNAVEISPTPPAGATYFNLTQVAPFFWNGAAWVLYGGSAGIPPHGPANSIQTANSGVNGLNSLPDFILNPATDLFQSLGNQQVKALESLPRVIYDPMNTNYLGGLAAAIAGSSGNTPTQVIQAAIDFGECQFQMGLAPQQMRIALPTGLTINLSQVLLWPQQEFSGESIANHPNFQHIDATKAMITMHGSSDTITCSNSQTYTPGTPAGELVRNIGIGGMGPQNQPNDIGVFMNCFSCEVSNIAGFTNGFGGEAIFAQGTSVFMRFLGYNGSQLKGCQSYITGLLPISSSPTGSQCGSVEDVNLDSEMDYVYATDGAQFNTGHAAGPCYPNCAAIIEHGANNHAEHLFGQVSDIGIIVNTAGARLLDLRADASSREGVRIEGNTTSIVGVVSDSPCTDTALQSAYNAGTPTVCGGIAAIGSGFTGGNNISDIIIETTPGEFGPSFINGSVYDSIQSVAPNTYGFLNFIGNPDNLTANDLAYATNNAFGGTSFGRAIFPSSGPISANHATVNISGISQVQLNTSTPMTAAWFGIPGQYVSIYASINQGTATINPGAWDGIGGHHGINTCTGLPETVTSQHGILFQIGADFNHLSEVGCNTQVNFVHLNWLNNGNPTNPGIVDFFGNEQARQTPLVPFDGTAIQLHGPAAPSGQYCFEEEAVYADLSHTVSPIACTNVDLAHQTGGEVFQPISPQAIALNLWLVSNTTTSGITIGKFPPAVNGQWDGPTTIAAGGNGATAPPASENTTGHVFDPWGVANNTAGNPQPTCNAFLRGTQWMIDGGGTAPDTFQICVKTTGGAFAWVTH